MKKIYFDNAATSFPKAPLMSQTISNFIENNCVNINRGVYSMSDDLSDMVLDTRVKLAKLFDCSDNPIKFCKRIIFTSGVTQSINMFLRGTLQNGDHVVTGSMEHHAVMRTLYDLQKEKNITFDVAKCDDNGVVTADSVKNMLKDNTKAVIINHASNVFGAVSKIKDIGALCFEKGIFFAVDTAQTAGVIDISMRDCNIDFLAFSGHKGLLGLQGIGGFAVSENLSAVLKPTVTGGTGSASHFYSQPDILPDKFESGTLNLCGIISLGHSLDYINSVGVNNIRQRELELRRYFIERIKRIDNAEDIKIHCADDVDITAVVSLSFKTLDNAFVASALERDYSVMTRCGLHCSPLAHSSMGTYPEGTVRFSFSYFNTEEEIDYTADAIQKILKENNNA